MTPLHAVELLAGISLAQTLVAVLLTLVILVCMQLLGIYNQGNWGLIILVCIPLTFSALAMGLLAACFIQNDFAAYNVASVSVMPQVFMSGALFPIPSITLFSLLGHDIGFFEFIPATHAVIILRQLFLGDAGLEEIGFRMGCLVLLSLIYFALGAWAFGQFKMRKRA
jgi:ABC-type polysaccharide/polyol phosphate export permease